jgi:REP element-mobilizing transposase RayT
MARAKRILFNRAVYHICIRGNNRQAVLEHDEDKSAFIDTLNKYRVRFGFRLFGFVLMDNHVHLVIETINQVSISKIMQAVMLSYSQKFRNKYDYVGYVWQGRFKSKVIEGEDYILECLNYIHNNPLRANIVTKLKEYKWSSYHKYNENDNPLDEAIEIDLVKL